MLDKKWFKIILVHCFNQGFLTTVGRLDFKQSSANGRMRFTQLYYAHSQVTCRGSTRILYLLLIMDENGYDTFPHKELEINHG
jgi:hypothetical protein